MAIGLETLSRDAIWCIYLMDNIIVTLWRAQAIYVDLILHAHITAINFPRNLNDPVFLSLTPIVPKLNVPVPT